MPENAPFYFYFDKFVPKNCVISVTTASASDKKLDS